MKLHTPKRSRKRAPVRDDSTTTRPAERVSEEERKRERSSALAYVANTCGAGCCWLEASRRRNGDTSRLMRLYSSIVFGCTLIGCIYFDTLNPCIAGLRSDSPCVCVCMCDTRYHSQASEPCKATDILFDFQYINSVLSFPTLSISTPCLTHNPLQTHNAQRKMVLLPYAD